MMREFAARLTAATEHLDPPLLAIDLEAFDANAADLVRRAAGVPIRVASKSIRSRALLARALATPGYAGVLAYSAAEAVFLARGGMTDLLVGYPSVDRSALAAIASDPDLAGRIVLMVDGREQLDVLDSVCAGTAGSDRAMVRLAVDVDASLRVGRVHLGVRRSPLREVHEVREVVTEAQARGYQVTGLMFYDAQIAGLPDSSPAIRAVKVRSHRQLLERRAAIRAAVAELTDLTIVNGGGTGSLHLTGRDPALTELAAGSGLFGPTLFDGYDDFRPRPAVAFALPVVRRPADGMITAFGGGYIASGPAGPSRVPSPVGVGLKLRRDEGAGEVQTPLIGRRAGAIRVGDRVWFRHAKSGEIAERFNQFHCVTGSSVTGEARTYRGEGQAFG